MQFSDRKAIYLQIVDYICEKIVMEVYEANSKIPSVRELAHMLSVNPNTIMRTVEKLQQLEVLENKRGLGLFVQAGGLPRAKKYLKDGFMDHELPVLFKSMDLLGIDMKMLQNYFDHFTTENIKSSH